MLFTFLPTDGEERNQSKMLGYGTHWDMHISTLQVKHVLLSVTSNLFLPLFTVYLVTL